MSATVLCSPGGRVFFCKKSMAYFRFDLREMFRVGLLSCSDVHPATTTSMSLVTLALRSNSPGMTQAYYVD